MVDRPIRTFISGPEAFDLLNRGKSWLRLVDKLEPFGPGNPFNELVRNSLGNRTLIGVNGEVLRTQRGPINFVSAQVPRQEQAVEEREYILEDFYIGSNVYNYDGDVLLGVVYAPIKITASGLASKAIAQAEWRFIPAGNFPGGVVPDAIEYNLGGDAASRFATSWQRCADRGTGYIFTDGVFDFYEIMPSSRSADGKPFFVEEVEASVSENLNEIAGVFPENFVVPGVPYYDDYWYSDGSIDPLGELHGQLKTGIASIEAIIGSGLVFFMNGGYQPWNHALWGHRITEYGHEHYAFGWMVEPGLIHVPYSMPLGSASGSITNLYTHVTRLKVGIVNPLDLGVWFEKTNTRVASLSFPNEYNNWWWTYLTATGTVDGENAKTPGPCGWRVDENHYGLAYFVERHSAVQYAGGWDDAIQESLILSGLPLSERLPTNNTDLFFIVGGYTSPRTFYGAYADGPPKRSAVVATYEINGVRVPIFVADDRENSVVAANDKRYYMHTETNGMVYSVMDVRASGGLCVIAIADQRGQVCRYEHTRSDNRPAIHLTSVDGQALYVNATTPGLRLLKASAKLQ